MRVAAYDGITIYDHSIGSPAVNLYMISLVPYNNAIYGLLNTGELYHFSGNSWTLDDTVSSTYNAFLFTFRDSLYTLDEVGTFTDTLEIWNIYNSS